MGAKAGKVSGEMAARDGKRKDSSSGGSKRAAGMFFLLFYERSIDGNCRHNRFKFITSIPIHWFFQFVHTVAISGSLRRFEGGDSVFCIFF